MAWPQAAWPHNAHLLLYNLEGMRLRLTSLTWSALVCWPGTIGFWWTCDAHNTISKLVNVAKSFQGRGASPVWRQFFWRRCNARVWGINCVAPTRAGCPSILFWIQPEATQQSSSRKKLTLPSWPSRGYGAAAARLTPDQKVGSSNLSGLIWLGLKRPGPIMRIFYYTTLRLCACDLHL